MTPAEVRALEAPVYMAMLLHMDREFREIRKAQRKR
jgi:hypothetical protein